MIKLTLAEKIMDCLCCIVFGIGSFWAGIMFFINQPEEESFFLLHNFMGFVCIFLGIVMLIVLKSTINNNEGLIKK